MSDSAAALAPRLTLDISGMHCAGCAGTVERALEKLAGAGKARVNLSLERAEVDGDVSPAAAVKAVLEAGYSATPRAGTAAERRMARARREADQRAAARQTLLQAALATLILLPFLADMTAMLLGYGHGALLSPMVQLVLAAIVQLICGWRFVVDGLRAVLRLSPNMDTLVALGTLAAFGISAWRVLSGHADHGAPLYFEGGVAVIAFVLIGKTIEGLARGEARDALDALEREQPATALVHRSDAWVEAPAGSLQVGEYFALRAGERAAADGVVRLGASAVDERLVTGESMPRPVGPGGRIVAGSLNGDGALTVEATAVGEDSTLARLSRLVEQAQADKSPSQRLADAVAR
ncbi:MAG: heavy metal translocating P-type ATPase, partial [Beijerinckiaceae bacterium]